FEFLELPASVSSAPPPATQAAQATGTRNRCQSGAERILVVEDNDMVRQFVSSQLTALGYSVVGAGSGTQAVELMQSYQDFDLVFADLTLPGGIDGCEVAGR